MKRFAFLIVFFATTIIQTSAQNEIDALRYSMFNPTGTARFVATGGAFGALGGDFSSLYTNPAGIGIYRSNEFTITPSFNFTAVESGFRGSLQEDINYDFSLGNLGFVFAFNDPNQLKESGWMGFQIGFGINQIANFNSRKIYEGFNTDNSLMSVFLEKATEETNFNSTMHPSSFLDDYTTGLAWDVWLLGLDSINNEYFIDMPKDVLQRRITNTSGSIREMSLTLGTNYSNKLYLGASLGFPIVRFEEDYTFTEENSTGIESEFNSLEFGESLITTGTGFNLKVGVIYRATDMIRLGAALHTPTFYTFDDEWSTHMESDLVNFGKREKSSPSLLYEYELNTPLRLTGSLGLVFGTSGLLSLDYEYADYTQMRLRSSQDPYTQENRNISNNFLSQHIIRAGGEYRLNPIILRAGYALHTNPYRPEINNLERTTISAGIGIREKNYFVDFGYYITQYSEDFFQYFNFTEDRSSVIEYDYSRQGFMMTVGFRF